MSAQGSNRVPDKFSTGRGGLKPKTVPSTDRRNLPPGITPENRGRLLCIHHQPIAPCPQLEVAQFIKPGVIPARRSCARGPGLSAGLTSSSALESVIEIENEPE